MIRLVKPSMKYAASFKKALLEFKKEGRHNEGDPNDIDGYIKITKQYAADNVPRGKVGESKLWIIDEGMFIGRIGIRHKLNKKLRQFGGHIGYTIRPSKRKKGYGTKAMKLALHKAKSLGISKIMVTCDDDNIASQKIIERSGGKLRKKIMWEGKLIRHYWIDNR